MLYGSCCRGEETFSYAKSQRLCRRIKSRGGESNSQGRKEVDCGEGALTVDADELRGELMVLKPIMKLLVVPQLR